MNDTPHPPGAGLFRAEALAYHRSGGARGDILRITPAMFSAVTWFVVAVVVCCIAFVCTAQVVDYAEGPALVMMDNRRDVTATRSGVVAEVTTYVGAHVREGDVLMRLHGAQEAAELASAERELSDQLVLLMRTPGDRDARDAVLRLRTRRDVALTTLERSVLRAPTAGEVTDLRARPGQMVEAGAPLLALQSDPQSAGVTALLAGPERPRLRPGMPLRLHIDGFERTSIELLIDRVDEQVLGPAEATRALGTELAGALEVRGPVIMVHAPVPEATFRSRGVVYYMHHGMPARAEVPVQRESLLYAWMPGLGEALSDVF